MRIRKLRLINWCNHADRTVEFGDFTSVRGPNGSGKSNLINGLVYAFTAQARNDGKAIENVSMGLEEGAPCSVTAWFDHGGTSYELHRSLSPARQWLKYDKEKITKANAIKEYLHTLLGVDEKVILDYVFVEQWGMFSFLAADDKDRAKAFSQLFGTDKAGKIWDALQKPPIPTIEIHPEGPTAAKDLAAAMRDIESYEKSLTSIEEDFETRQASFKAADETVLKAARAKQAAEVLKVAELKTEATRGQINALSLELAKIKLHYLNSLKSRDELDAKVRAEADALRNWQAYRQWKTKVDRALLEVSQAEATLAAVNARRPAKPVDYIEESEREPVSRELFQARVQLSACRTLLESCAGKVNCPTCQTATSGIELKQRIERARTDAPLLSAAIQDLERVSAETVAYDKALGVWATSAAKLQSELDVAKTRLDAHGTVERPEGPEVREDPSILSRLESARRVVVSCQKAEADAEKLLAQLQGRLESEAAHQVELSKHASETVSDNDLAHAKALQSDRQQLTQLKEEAVSGLERALGRAERLEGLAAGYEASRTKIEALRGLSTHLENVRELFHRERLPMAVSQYYLNLLKEDTNRILNDLELPFRSFRIESVDDLRFVVRFADDGTLCRAERLSGGQKVVLALAFRLAVHFMFAADLGILCLDEPTAGLDDDNLATLSTALSKLREVSKARGLQIVLITHERMLDNLCDRVVSLTGAS